MSHGSIASKVICTLSLLLPACGGSQPNAEAPPPAATTEAPSNALPADSSTPQSEAVSPAPPAKKIETTLQSKSKSKVTGTATLTETTNGVSVVLVVENLTPGEHGAHVHEKGDCSAEDASSAGGHFNPGSHPHALPSGTPRHLGDLGNITADKDGKAKLEIIALGANLKDSDPSSFVGRSIVIHEKKDDGGQPTGNAGGRIGCAPIE